MQRKLSALILCAILCLGLQAQDFKVMRRNVPPPTGGGAKAFIQACTQANVAGGGLNITATCSSSIIAGHALVVIVGWSDGGVAGTPGNTDVTGSSDTFTFISGRTIRATTDQYELAMYWVSSTVGGYTNVVFACDDRNATLHCGGFQAMIVYEVSNVTGLDGGTQQLKNPGSATTDADTCGASTFTTTVNTDFIIAAFSDTATSGTFTAGTSPIAYTHTTNETTGGTLFVGEHGTQTTAGTINPTATGANTENYIAICEALK